MVVLYVYATTSNDLVMNRIVSVQSLVDILRRADFSVPYSLSREKSNTFTHLFISNILKLRNTFVSESETLGIKLGERQNLQDFFLSCLSFWLPPCASVKTKLIAT